MQSEPLAIDEIMPAYDAQSSHSICINAPAAMVYDAARHARFESSPLITALFALRSAPAHMFSKKRRRQTLNLSIDALEKNGFTVISERPGKEFVLGLVGRFWTLSGDLQRVKPLDFRSFTDERYAKAVWGFSLNDLGGRSMLSTQTRVVCLSEAARKRFLLYWRFIAPFSSLIRNEVLRQIKATAETAKES